MRIEETWGVYCQLQNSVTPWFWQVHTDNELWRRPNFKIISNIVTQYWGKADFKNKSKFSSAHHMELMKCSYINNHILQL